MVKITTGVTDGEDGSTQEDQINASVPCLAKL